MLKDSRQWSALVACAAAVLAVGGCGDDTSGVGGGGGSGGAASTSSSSSTASAASVVSSAASTGSSTAGPGGGEGGNGDGGGVGPSSSGSSSDGGGGAGQGGGGGDGASQGGGGSGNGGNGGNGSGGDGGGGGLPACVATAEGPSKGGPIAVGPADDVIVAANRDAGSVSIFPLSFDAGLPVLDDAQEIAVGAEPSQVVIDPCGDRAFVALRAERRVVAIENLRGEPALGASVAVGSEPTGIALSPNGTRLYVANWVEGTVSVIDPIEMAVTSTIDLNAPLAATGLLGPSVAGSSRPALAHPRSIAITNDGDGDDDDETVIVTEFFTQRTAPESENGGNADANWVGLLYRFDAGDPEVDTIQLRPLADTGFDDSNGLATGCFPNQLQGVTLRGGLAYVTSICASPKGPVGGVNVRAMTHPIVSVVDVAAGTELSGSPANLNDAFQSFYAEQAFVDDASRRYPLVANDVAFDPATGAAFVTANGTDAVFRVVLADDDGSVEEVGAGATRPFVDLDAAALPEGVRGQNPIGLASAHGSGFAFVLNDVTRTVTAISTIAGSEEVAGSTAGDPRGARSSALPVDPTDAAALRGRRVFNTGLGRMSLNGQGWGACQSCHFEGLSDNVTWYFGRGPRQSTSLDGSFASGDPTDQRIFNWTAVFDEVADFENVARGTNGGVGAIVHTVSDPPVVGDRVDFANTTTYPTEGAVGVAGSLGDIMAADSELQWWDDVEVFMQRIRSPRAPVGLDPDLVADGSALFAGDGGCQGCHGGAKWTLSQRFYTPGTAINLALKTTTYDGAALVAGGFPAALLPADAGSQVMRSGVGGDQIQCVLRPVGTFGVSPAAIDVRELRADMSTVAQGGAANGNGYNVPSLLGMQVGAPYFHAGNARTLEEVLDDVFVTHREALAADGFFDDDPAAQRAALVQFLLSVDETTTTLPLPEVGALGGTFCDGP